MITTAYVIDAKGLLVTQAGSVRLIPWTSIRFIHVHVTSGVGSTGFPVYSARLRMLFASREISSLHWQGEARTDQSAGYVRFMEELIPFAIARNPRDSPPTRWRPYARGSDPDGAVSRLHAILVDTVLDR